MTRRDPNRAVDNVAINREIAGVIDAQPVRID
jgi:hypothetical protein